MHSLFRHLMRGKGLYIGEIFHDAVRRDPTTEVVLDRPLQWASARETRFTVSQLADQVEELAARLWAAGVRPTERVAIYKTENFDIVLLACAVARIGAVPALLSSALDGEVVLTLLRRLDRPWLITDGGTLEGALLEVPVADVTQAVLLSAGADTVGTTTIASYAGAPRREPVFLHPQQPSLITHTSGTTGVPKLDVHCPEALRFRLLPQKLWSWPFRERETAALCTSLSHSRFYSGLATFLGYGNPVVVPVDLEPQQIGPLFVRTRPGYVETHPNNFVDWEDLADAPGAPLSSVRYFFSTFDAMHPRTLRRMLGASKRPRPLFLQVYAQSEIGPLAGRWYTRRSVDQANGRCVGMPLPGFISMRVVDCDGRRVRAGKVGHLEVRSRSRILTYLGEHEQYRSNLRDGWWHIGDIGYRDRWGLLYLLDREADRIASVDSNLAAEDLLMTRLEELREVVVVAGSQGESVTVVCTRDGRPIDEKRWEEATRDLPISAVRQLPFEALPRTSTRKIRRAELARLVSGGDPLVEATRGGTDRWAVETMTESAERRPRAWSRLRGSGASGGEERVS